MHFSTRILALSLLGGVAFAVPAAADPVSGQVGVASEYVGKGLGKSDEQPAAFGSVRWETGGFYASGFVSQAASTRGADAEVILSAGYQRELIGLDVDILVMRREMAGESRGIDSGYFEFQADVSRDLTDRINARLRVNYSPDTYGAVDAAWWSEVQASFKLTSADKLSAAYALRRMDNSLTYDAWNIGVKHKFTPAIAADVRWYDTDRHDVGVRYAGRLVASLSYSF